MTSRGKRGRHAMTVLVLCVGCRTERTSGAAPAAAPSARPPMPQSPSFRADVLPVLSRHCAEAKECHGADRTDSVDLDLTPGAAHAELVGHVSDVRTSMLRVSAGDPTASFLINKLSGDLNHDEGKRMPLDPETGAPAVPNPVPATFVNDVLVPWIRAGAKDD